MSVLLGGDAMINERHIAGMPLVESCMHGIKGHRTAGSGVLIPHFAITFIMEGWLGGKDGDTLHQQNDIMIWPSHLPRAFKASEHVLLQTLIVPVDAMGEAMSFSEKNSLVKLSGDGGLGPMVSGLFDGLLRNIDRIPSGQHLEALNTTLNVLSNAMNVERERKTQTRPEECLARVLHYINHHLHDADLNPSSIARANRISVRYLHTLFARQGMTVTSLVRERRLRYAMEALRSEPHTSITEIAFRLGFQDSAHFSRLFRQRFNMAAQSFRRMHEAP